jgi:hypothetical protein
MHHKKDEAAAAADLYMQRMMTISSAHTIRFVFPVGPALQNTSSLSSSSHTILKRETK